LRAIWKIVEQRPDEAASLARLAGNLSWRA
jgi:hypothetical protein